MSFVIFSHSFRFDERKLVQYPSISVCVEYSFKKYIDEEINDFNITFHDTVELIDNQNWKRNDTFYFLNHKVDTKGSFPCMTIKESEDAGRPCHFPFTYNTRKALLSFKNERYVEEGYYLITKYKNYK